MLVDVSILADENYTDGIMRSLLTSLGVIIGVGSVIIMVALSEGSQCEIEARITVMGTNLLQIMPRR